jgi:hypothetical protein
MILHPCLYFPKGLWAMLQSIRWMSWTLLFALALPVVAADEKKGAKKKDKEDEADPKEAKKEKLSYGTVFVAKMTDVAANSQKDFTVEVTYRYLQPNVQAIAQYQQKQQQLAIRLQQIQYIRNAYQRQQALIQLQQQAQQVPQNLYTVKTVNKKVELRGSEEVKVRTLQPPIDYDEKGNVKKYTKKELKELKGPGNLPGYTGEFDNLRAGQVVRIYLAKSKKKLALNKKAKKGKKKKKEDEDLEDDENLDEDKPEAVMIVILQEPKEKG